MRHRNLLLVLAMGTSVWLSMPLNAAVNAPPSLEDAIISRATLVFRRAVDTPVTAIPAAVMKRARAIAIVPGAFNHGTFNSGTGIVSARTVDGQQWSAPAVLGYDGRIVPALDEDTIDLILIAVSSRGLDYLSRDEMWIGEPGVISPGPLGEDTQTGMNADILGYVQFGDFFAGLTVEQWSICAAPWANERLYGHPLNTSDVFRGGFKAPAVVQAWGEALAGYYKETS